MLVTRAEDVLNVDISLVLIGLVRAGLDVKSVITNAMQTLMLRSI